MVGELADATSLNLRSGGMSDYFIESSTLQYHAHGMDWTCMNGLTKVVHIHSGAEVYIQQ